MNAASPVKTAATPTDWFPDWSKSQCVIVASGPSANTINLAIARDKAKFIAVNNSWRLAPWADVLYGCDFSWWNKHKGVPEFKGLKVSQDQKCPRKYPEIRNVHCVRSYDGGGKLVSARGSIGWGGNGGFQALNLAIQFGSKKILLVGFDMRIDKGLHWHGSHRKSDGLHDPHAAQVERWRKALDAAKPSLDAQGVRVVNCSPVSALKAYPKMKFEEALNG